MQEDKEKEMTKDVVVSLKGLQLAPDQQSDAVEVIAPGEYYIRNNKHLSLIHICSELTGGEDEKDSIIRFPLRRLWRRPVFAREKECRKLKENRTK